MMKKIFSGKSKASRIWIITSFIGICAGIWQSIYWLELYPKALFPSLLTIVQKLYVLMIQEQLIEKALYSMGIVFVSMLMSLVVALMFVLMGKWSNYLKINIRFLSTVLSPIPGIALLPVVILWLGLSFKAMLFIMIHAMLWPLWTHCIISEERIHSRYHRMIRSFKIPWYRQIGSIYLQGMRPDILAGLEVAWSRGWRALLSVEMIFGMIGTHSGLGWLIYERRMYMDTAGMFAGLFAIAICGIAVEEVLFKRLKREAKLEKSN